MKKHTQAELRSAVDTFLHVYGWLTGGTENEVRQQAPEGYKRLAELAADAARMAANPNKVAAANAHLMEYATELIPRKMERYAAMWLPNNIVQFPQS